MLEMLTSVAAINFALFQLLLCYATWVTKRHGWREAQRRVLFAVSQLTLAFGLLIWLVS